MDVNSSSNNNNTVNAKDGTINKTLNSVNATKESSSSNSCSKCIENRRRPDRRLEMAESQTMSHVRHPNGFVESNGIISNEIQRTNNLLASQATTSSRSNEISASTTGARPKIRSQPSLSSGFFGGLQGDSSDSENESCFSGQVATTHHPGRIKSIGNGVTSETDSELDINGVSDESCIYKYKFNENSSKSQRKKLVADLPKSFYHVDMSSDSEGMSGTSLGTQGVSWAGQSNLSAEVAALIQSELATTSSESHNRRSRVEHQDENFDLLNIEESFRRPQSPDQDFLEMDFVASDRSGEDSDDSGQGADENVTETIEEESSVIETDPDRRYTVDSIESQNGMQHFINDDVPDRLNLADILNSVVETNNVTEAAAKGVTPGVMTAPTTTPVREDISMVSSMVRSKSLNSPIQDIADKNMRNRNRGIDIHCPINRSDLIYESSMTDSGRRRLISGDKRKNPFDNPSVNMEVCGARLCQRENYLFNSGLPSLHHTIGVSMPSSSSISSICDKKMIWSESEACQRQVTQVGTSACGPTALINVLMALNHPSAKTEVVAKAVKTRLRAESAPLPEYLSSRSVAGTTHEDLIETVQALTNNEVFGKFFHMFPKRNFILITWLQEWISLGAVPLVTLNLQRGVKAGQTIPDSWHHQMVFGVSSNGVYLTNPLEVVKESVIIQQLCSPSVLLIRRNDILSRYDSTNCDLSILSEMSDERWDHLNVLGQVVNVLREEKSLKGDRRNKNKVLTSHVKIPAAYKSGITLFMSRSNKHAEKLLSCSELPVKMVNGASGCSSSEVDLACGQFA